MNVTSGTIGRALSKLHDKFHELGCGCSLEDMVDLIVSSSNEHWRWRAQIAQVIADSLNFEQFGIIGVYIIGSTKNAMAGPLSDIDLMIHHAGTDQQVQELVQRIDRWGQAVAEMNFYRTSQKTENLIDLHLVTNEDIAQKTSYAVMIGRSTDGARLLKTISPESKVK